ncbi:hypothetical protein DSECCO2_628280 [anaerobic digester metagenome]
MNVACCIINDCFGTFITLFGFVISILAIIAFALYWFKPRFDISVKHDKKKEIRVVIFNKNCPRIKIVDIKCEATLSEDRDFSGVVNTLDSIKDSIICLKAPPANYTFKFEESKLAQKNYLRIRLLANNIIGIKKVTEKVYEIIPKNDDYTFNPI